MSTARSQQGTSKSTTRCLRDTALGLAAGIAGFFGGNHLPSSGSVSTSTQDSVTPRTISEPKNESAPSVFTSAQLDSILAEKNTAVKFARFREWIRHIPVEQLIPDMERAIAADEELLDSGLMAWAERDGEASRRWMLSKFPGHDSSLQAWVRGLARTAPISASKWFDAHGAADMATMKANETAVIEQLAGGMAETNPSGAWKFLSEHKLNRDTAKSTLTEWMKQDPNAALTAWKSWRKADLETLTLAWNKRTDRKPDEVPPTGSEADDLLPDLIGALKNQPKEIAEAFLRENVEVFKNVHVLAEVISQAPDFWLSQAMSADAPEWLRSEAESWATKSPRWTLSHLDQFDPATQQRLIQSSLESASEFKGGPSAQLAGRKLTDWLDMLEPAGRSKVVARVAAGELVNDPTLALKLASEVTDLEGRKGFFEVAHFAAAIEPRLLEQKILSAEGSEEDKNNLRLAFSLGAGGIFGSPHDSICRAASFTDPALRHQSLVMALAGEKDPAVRQMTFDWLGSMPEGTVDKQQMASALDRMKLQIPAFFEKIGESHGEDKPDFDAVQKLIQQLP